MTKKEVTTLKTNKSRPSNKTGILQELLRVKVVAGWILPVPQTFPSKDRKEFLETESLKSMIAYF